MFRSKYYKYNADSQYIYRESRALIPNPDEHIFFYYIEVSFFDTALFNFSFAY